MQVVSAAAAAKVPNGGAEGPEPLRGGAAAETEHSGRERHGPQQAAGTLKLSSGARAAPAPVRDPGHSGSLAGRWEGLVAWPPAGQATSAYQAAAA